MENNGEVVLTKIKPFLSKCEVDICNELILIKTGWSYLLWGMGSTPF